MKRIIPFIIGAALCAPLSASAATFDAMCAPETEHNPGLLAPNLAFMLDKSGSMGHDSSEAGKSRWVASKEAINETVVAFTNEPTPPATMGSCTGSSDPDCDQVRFGLALFNSRATFPIKVGEDTAQAIKTELENNMPNDTTAMGLAAQLLAADSSLNDATRSNHAVFITDGYPHVGCGYAENRGTLVDAVLALCQASTRSNPLTTSVIGFGGDTHTQTISLLAAAGGTGSCCDSGDCSAKPIDICSLNKTELENLMEPVDEGDGNCYYGLPDPRIITCTGGIEITSNTELKNAISGIVAEAACTFPLDIPAGYPDGVAQADPDFTRVELNHRVHGSVVVDNIGDCQAPSANTPTGLPSPDYDDQGWCFVNNRRSIRVTDKLCQDIGASDVEKVVTQVACVCRLTGQPCSITNVMCGNQPCTNEQLMNMPCSSGVYVCDKGQDVCQGVGALLPEICNGVDDNCDGKVDNLGDSETDWASYPTQRDNTALHCEFENVCACDGGAKAVVTNSGGVDQLLLDAIPECSCQSALEFDESSASQEETDNTHDSSGATCSALSKDPSGLLYLLIPIGLVGVMRRRRKS